VLSFPAHIVRQYIVNEFEVAAGGTVLDPFCGTGTTIVEAQQLGYRAVGVEANTLAYFASSVKARCGTDALSLRRWSQQIANDANRKISLARAFRKLADDEAGLLLADCIGSRPLHKVLMLRETIEASGDPELHDYGMLALAKTSVQTASNLHFGPEVGIRGRKADAPVVAAWLKNMDQVADDIELTEQNRKYPANVIKGDSRDLRSLIEPASIDAVFTSPPYPNEKDYTRTTRLESVLLRFLSNKAELRAVKQSLLRSNTRNVYKADSDHTFVENNSRIQAIAKEIEDKREFLGKTSGFEKLYGRVTKLYFGGMARHLETIKPLLKHGAHLGYVVGDQASYLQIHIPTGSILAEIAESLGYTHVRTDLFRTRLATATKQQIREEVVILRND